ncbi:unnamed protein product [Prorocentrum cordatum]|uniref:Uncharacterized protein n=1 Tax=Prorocentrum cordatum TaxID=2364126 RepID=A0ABN9V8J9_9DINO|nr:unnamed protein product [Polarella glacialis]
MLRCLTEGRHSARGEGRVLEARPGDLQRDREGGGAEEAGALRLLPRQGAVVAEHGRVRAVTARGRPPQRELQRGPGHRERGGGGPEVLHHRGGRCSGRQERRAGDVLRHRRLLRRARAHPKPAPRRHGDLQDRRQDLEHRQSELQPPAQGQRPPGALRQVQLSRPRARTPREAGPGCGREQRSRRRAAPPDRERGSCPAPEAPGGARQPVTCRSAGPARRAAPIPDRRPRRSRWALGSGGGQ